MLGKVNVAYIDSGVVIFGIQFEHVQVAFARVIQIALGAAGLGRFHGLVDFRPLRELQVRAVLRNGEKRFQQFPSIAQLLCFHR